jgi:hypothetical protein
LVIISYTTSLSFALERIGPLAAITIIVFYLLILYLLALPNTPENPFASIYSESLIKTTCQQLLLLVGFDTYLSKVLRYTPYTCGSSGCRCAAPSGCNVAAFRLRHRLPTRLPRHVRRWWSCRCIDSRPVAMCPFRASRRYTRSSLSSPRTDVPGCRCIAIHGAGRHVHAWSSSSVRFFHAYIEHRCRASTGNLHNLLWPAQVPPTTSAIV